MGVIALSEEPEQYWQAAGWAFRQVLDDVARLHPDDLDLQKACDQAKVYDSLSVYALPQELAERTVEHLKQVAEGVLAGTIQSGITTQSYGNSDTQGEYKSGLQQLLLVLCAGSK